MEILIRSFTQNDFTMICDKLLTEYDDFWTPSVLASELKNPNSSYFVAEQNGEVVGFAGIWKAVDEVHLTNIVTKKEKRNQKIASTLLAYLINYTKKIGFSSITLEVHEDNLPAIHLYQLYHFEKVGLRKNYYPQNANAIIMTLNFEKEKTNEKK